MRFAILASGSAGNAAIVATSRTTVLIDCGLSARSAERRLAQLGLVPEDIDALFVTHEHVDHTAGVAPLARRFGIPVHLTRGTAAAAMLAADRLRRHETFAPERPFRIGDLDVLPIPVPHDAREPIQFVFEHDGRRLGMLTDAGCSTDSIVEHYGGCNALIVEFNHDLDLLHGSDYPARVKSRIRGDLGHLSNDQAAALLARLDRRRLRHVVAAHVSRRTNSRDRVARRLVELTSRAAVSWAIAEQDAILPWHEIV